MEQNKEVVTTEINRMKQMWDWWRAKFALAAQSPWYASYLLRRFYDLMHALRPSKQLVASTVTGAALLVGSIAMNPAPAHAATITVNSITDTTANDGKCTLREAIMAASTNTASGAAVGECIAGGVGSDTIDLTGVNGTIALGSSLPTITNSGEDMVLNGPGAGQLTIQGGGRLTSYSNVTLDSLTFNSNMRTYYSDTTVKNAVVSGGISPFNGSAVITNSTFNGGEVAAYYGDVTISNSTLSGNVKSMRGKVSLLNSTISGIPNNSPAVYAHQGNVVIADSTISDNGKAIYTRYSAVAVTNSTISNNNSIGVETNYGAISVVKSTISGNTGAGVRAYQDLIQVTNSTISNNGAGGISASRSSVAMNNSIVTGNTGVGIDSTWVSMVDTIVSKNTGQGILSYGTRFGTAQVSLTNTTLSENGGGILARSGGVDVVSSTISGNLSPAIIGTYIKVNSSTISGNNGTGIGIYEAGSGGTGDIINSTVTGNAGMGLVVTGSFPPYNARVNLKNSLIVGNNVTANTGDVSCNPSSYAPISTNGKNLISNSAACPTLAGEVTAVPVASIISPLANNGGSTQTHALVAGSPAIDAGNNADSPATTDQRGYARMVNGTIDIGSVESATTSTGTGSFGLKTTLGAITNLFAKNAAQAVALCKNTPLPSGYIFPHGFFEFDVTGVGTGGSTNVTFTLPKALPKGTKILKCNAANQWVELPNPSDDGDNIITFGLTDGNSTSDQDGIANGVIHDPVGPVVPSAVGGVAEFITPNAASPVTTTGIMATVSALLMGAGAWLMRRR